MRELNIPKRDAPSPIVSEQWKKQNAWLEQQLDGDYFLFVQRFDRAETSFLNAIKTAEVSGFKDARLARSYTGLARAHAARRHYEESIREYEKALAIKKKAYGNNHSDVADILTELAYVRILMNQVKEARGLVSEAAQVWKNLKTDSLTELAFVDAAVSVQEGNDAAAGEKLKNASARYLAQLDLHRYPQSVKSIRLARDCGERYAIWLDIHHKDAEAKACREKFKPINEWLMTLGETGV